VKAFVPRNKHGPEYSIQRNFVRFLEDRHWLVERMIGNVYQTGIPDLFIAHKKYGTRFLDIKNPISYNFTAAQRWKWPIWDKFGIGIWIITAATEEEYQKLFKDPNWKDYWKESYNERSIKNAFKDLS